MKRLAFLLAVCTMPVTACGLADQLSGWEESKQIAGVLSGPSVVKAKEVFQVSGRVEGLSPITKVLPLIYYDRRLAYAVVYQRVNAHEFRQLFAQFATFSATYSIEQPGTYKLSGAASYSTIVVE